MLEIYTLSGLYQWDSEQMYELKFQLDHMRVRQMRAVIR